MSRRDPYLYEDVLVLKYLPGIKNSEELKIAEGDLTRMSMGRDLCALVSENFNF